VLEFGCQVGTTEPTPRHLAGTVCMLDMVLLGRQVLQADHMLLINLICRS
jgi:hypothetical protein